MSATLTLQRHNVWHLDRVSLDFLHICDASRLLVVSFFSGTRALVCAWLFGMDSKSLDGPWPTSPPSASGIAVGVSGHPKRYCEPALGFWLLRWFL